MRFSVISSGSKANCTYVEGGGTALLIDCGLSAKRTEERLRLLGLDPESLTGIIITHEHRDHINGVEVMSRRFKLPVFANRGVIPYLKGVYGVERFETGESFSVGALNVRPFSIVHDAADPVGFVLEAEGLKFSQATDLGRITPLVRDALTGSQALVLESNYDEELLMSCDYSWELKQRIASTHGHLSNDNAGEFLCEIMNSELLHVVLGHLSENSNNPQTALESANRYLAERTPYNLLCGSVYHSTPLIEIGSIAGAERAVG